MKDKDILELLGLTDRTIQVELTKDIENIANNGYEKFLNEYEEHENQKKWFLKMFKECYDDLCRFMEKDPKKRIAVNCYTCLRGVDLSKQYGKPKKK